MKSKMLSILSKYSISVEKLIGSFLVTLLIISQVFFGISQFALGTTMPYKILLVLAAVFAFFYFEKHFSYKQVIVFLVVFFFFGITVIVNKHSSLFELFSSFVIYGCSAFIFSFCKIDNKCVFRLCILFSFVWLFLYFRNNNQLGISGVSTNGVDNSINDDLTVSDTFAFGYCILPAVVSSFLLLTYEKDYPWIIIIRIIVFIVLFYFLVTSGSRGPVLCFLAAVFVRFLPALKKPKQAIVYIIVLVSFIIALINITSIVTEIHNAIPGKLSFIEKTYSLLSRTSGDFSNGRFKIIADVFKEYEMKDFIFGIGVGTYNNTHVKEGYTHNLFVSVLLDFGIIGVVLLCVVLVLFIYYMFKDGEHTLFMVLLFTVSVVTLLFSGNYWKFFTLWLFIFFALGFNDSLKKKEAMVNDELNDLQRGVYA